MPVVKVKINDVKNVLENARKKNVVVSVATIKSLEETRALFKEPEFLHLLAGGVPMKLENHRIAFILLRAAKPNGRIHDDVINDINALGRRPLGVKIIDHRPWQKPDKMQPGEHGIFLYGPPAKLTRLVKALEQFKTIPEKTQPLNPPKKKFKFF